jgi:polyisoprenoid-binding protein YceI
MKTWMKWAIAAVVVVILGLVGGPFIYINFIKDDPPDRFALDEGDPSSAITGATATTAAAAGGATVASDPAATDPPTGDAPAATAATSTPAAAGAVWTVDSGASAVGYRVVEVLFGQDTEGVGRTSDVTGQLTLSGTQVTAADFEVDMTTVTSDEDRRDNQFRGRLLDTDNFPTATFTLTSPIELGTAPADGAAVTATATGDLTLRGTTQPVTIEVQAQQSGDTIQVVGSTDIVFADYGIPDPSTAGISTQEHGLLEFDLHFVPA